jgi:hypothetical protein
MSRPVLVFLLCAVGVIALANYVRTRSPLREGDTVSAVWDGGSVWPAGHQASLFVRLQATGDDGETRALGFGGLPYDANPRARVTFYKGEYVLGETTEVALSHRC